MHNIKKRSVSILIAFAMLVSLGIPVAAVGSENYLSDIGVQVVDVHI